MTTANIHGISEDPGKQRIQVERPVNIELDHEGEDRLLDLWLPLSALQRAILRLLYRHGDCEITYALIAANIGVPRLPGDDSDDSESDTDDIVSDRTVAKYCKILEGPPLELVQRPGKRSGLRLTARGARLMRFIAREDARRSRSFSPVR